MIHRVRRHPAIENDILGIAKYIGRDSPDSARRFLINADDTVVGLRYMPGRGSLKTMRGGKLAQVRTLAVREFPNHLIVYQTRSDGVYVLAIVEGHRNYRPLIRQRIAPLSPE